MCSSAKLFEQVKTENTKKLHETGCKLTLLDGTKYEIPGVTAHDMSLATSPRHARHTGVSQGVTTRHVSSSTSSQGARSRAATRTRPHPGTVSMLYGSPDIILSITLTQSKNAPRNVFRGFKRNHENKIN